MPLDGGSIFSGSVPLIAGGAQREHSPACLRDLIPRPVELVKHPAPPFPAHQAVRSTHCRPSPHASLSRLRLLSVPQAI